MGMLIRKHHGNRVFTGMAKLAFITFLVSLAAAGIDTIWAVYLQGFLHSDSAVGFLSGALSALAFISFFVLVPLIEKTNKIALFSISLIFTALIYILFAVNKSLAVLFFLSVILTIFTSIRFTSFGIIIRDKSDKKKLARNEGLMYTFANVSWVVGPLIAGFISVKFGVPSIFIIAAALTFFGFILLKFSRIKDDNVTKKVDGNILGNFLDFFKKKDRVMAYLLGAGVTFWWSLIYLYIPLYIFENNFNEIWIGTFLFMVAVPLIMLEYPLSKFSAKYGSKLLFQVGYFIPAAIAFVCFFLNSIILILALLVLASVGIAMLEPTTEAYFFDILKTKREENRFYGPYNTAIETGLVLGKILPAIALIFLPIKYIFIIFGLFMFALFVIATKSRDVVEEKN